MKVEREVLQEARVFADGAMNSWEAIQSEKIDKYCSIVKSGLVTELERRGKDKSLAEQLPDDVLLAVRDFIVRRDYEQTWIEVASEDKESAQLNRAKDLKQLSL